MTIKRDNRGVADAASQSIRGILGLSLLGMAVLCQFLGCVRYTSVPFESRRRPIIERICAKRSLTESQEVVQTQTDLVLGTGGPIERICPASNSRRILLERRLETDKAQTDFPKEFLLKETLEKESHERFGVELWNIEFSDARLECFCSDYVGLLAPTLGCAAFDEKGERLFWAYNGKQTSSGFPTLQADASVVTRCAAPSESESHLLLAPNDNMPFNSEGSLQPPNAILTRMLETRARRQDGNSYDAKSDTETKRLKLADETKRAEYARLSSNALWIICRANEDSITPEESPDVIESDWSLVLLRDRRRVVKIPSNIKMTFDNATSDEEIKGKVVDILDVSEKGDLVATLVEEQLPRFEHEYPNELSDSEEPTTLSGSGAILSDSPRYKIVIWDLNVARTVDLEKAKKPLTAIEVSQIPIPAPIPRKYCKFSPTGERFAARVEPRYVTIWQSANGRLSMELGEHDDVIQDFAFAPNSAKMIVGVGGKKARLSLWEIRKGVVLRTLDDTIDRATSIDAVSFAFDERYVFFANNLGEVRRWDVRAH